MIGVLANSFVELAEVFLVGHGCLFRSDWREGFLISRSYGMGDPMAPSKGEGNSEGGGRARRIASRQAKRVGITRP